MSQVLFDHMGKGHQVVGGWAVSAHERTSPNGALWAAQAEQGSDGPGLAGSDPGGGGAQGPGEQAARAEVAEEPVRVACC